MQRGLIERDLAVNWHPYTQMKGASIIPIVRGEGAYLYDADGKRYIDAVSSWWVTLHGHANKYIAEKVSRQLYTLEQVIFAGFTHPAAISLSEALLQLLPPSQKKIFYSDNGSTAVEVALKMCIQYGRNEGLNKTKILAFKNGYHGDTFGAMSVSSRGLWTSPFDEFLFEVLLADTPRESNFEDLQAFVDKNAKDILCFIYEPLVQGASGMLMHRAEDLSRLLALCRQHNILLIQDEVFVGFGRTGLPFAADHLPVKPDVMCLSKGLTGGTMPLGATSCTQRVYEAFYGDDQTKTLFHGHSFTANPLACTAALASITLLQASQTQQAIRLIGEMHGAFIEQTKAHPRLAAIRQCGTILALELKTLETTSYIHPVRDIVYHYFLDRGILIRPLGNIIYLVPPYCISKEDLQYIYQSIIRFLDEPIW